MSCCIAQAAELVGVPPTTLRYYEDPNGAIICLVGVAVVMFAPRS